MTGGSQLVSRLIVLILALLLQCSLKAAPQTMISVEMQALLQMKESLQDPEGHLKEWEMGAAGDVKGGAAEINACQRWRGVGCSKTPPYVVESLDLSSMNLSGNLSPHVGLLRNLAELSLASNNLSGPLPPQLWDIGRSLRLLNISNNLFQGHFPAANISKCSFLEVLDAYNNNFTGPLPTMINTLSRLRHLHLGGNFFEGSIPAQYGTLRNLTYLALSGNSLTGRIPIELGNLVLLQQLYLGYYNSFMGGIPSTLGQLSELIVLDMADCGLTGRIPGHLQNLTKLDSLFLQINSLTGSIPSELGSLTKLRSLDLSNNLLSGEIPHEFRHLSSLELLNLFRNQLHGPIPDFVGYLPSLQVLSLWENNFTGNLPRLLGSNRKLIIVDLSSNSLTGSIPPNLCNGGTLRRLVLFSNSLSGLIPSSLGGCTNLSHIRLGSNRLSGAIPSGILSLPSLQMLEAPRNLLNGTIPEIIPAVSKLGRLDLSMNQLNGLIPAGISNLLSLQTLLLAGNEVSGQIPSQFSYLKRLSKLDCSRNSLSGSIPAALGQCNALTYIDLSQNQLVGEIPSDLQHLHVLDYLNVSHNRLAGSIPLAFQNIQTLTSADFSFNKLSGVIPSKGQFATFNGSSFIGNAGLCGVQFYPCSALNSSVQVHNREGGEPALVYWLIVGIISSLTVIVFMVGIIYNRHAFCALFCKESMHGPWRFTAFQKLDFNATHVLSCLTDDNMIGKGGSGTVYKCITPSGFVAVKRLPGACSQVADPVVDGSDDHGFSAEIQTLGKIRHRNIVRLLGCCSSRDTNLLVYEYMPNGSLGELLHGTRGGTLDWGKRYKIAVDAARGLHYLHHDCSPLIVHRDVKSNNILLDSKYEAHVADFGLAKVLEYSESMSLVAGSYGYIAPEYIYTLKVDEKSDIYSFGVVLLELLSGRRPFEPEFGEGVDIVAWVREKVQSKEGILEVLDPKIRRDERMSPNRNNFMEEVMQVLKVALLCLVEPPMQRPTMREVVQMLTNVPKKKANMGVMITGSMSDYQTPSSSNSLSSSSLRSSLTSPPYWNSGKAISFGSSSPPDFISI
ncbi:hypothetical protein KP509_11G028700 [Ceratopteris richardii]|uniref:non-specific serine/threonine protein kinase n=1 Tax=Ceratopteris richardii TaxID=49495 RepID=A0A8T2TWJ4_CERRI|nr:hypothetical protein KP509_11G028700 [Ceratopteris richardii]